MSFENWNRFVKETLNQRERKPESPPQKKKATKEVRRNEQQKQS